MHAESTEAARQEGRALFDVPKEGFEIVAVSLFGL